MQMLDAIFLALFILMALTLAIKLPDYRRLAKVVKQLRAQAGFFEEQHALLQAIQDSVSDGILLIGEDGQMKAFNAPALDMLQSKENAIADLVSGPSDRRVVQWEERLMERFRTDVPGYGQLYVFHDITAQKRLAVEAQRLESLARLAQPLGHQFNNLLTGIIGNTSLALERLPAGDSLAPVLADVLRAGERAAELSRQLRVLLPAVEDAAQAEPIAHRAQAGN
jgi:signal transduction histidine kinase